MSRFNKWEFKKVISNMERDEAQDQNIWIAVGILEYMYDDDCGWIDEYFNTPIESRNWENLWEKLKEQLIK